MPNKFSITLLLTLMISVLHSQDIEVHAPNERLRVDVFISNTISLRVSLDDNLIIDQLDLGMDMGNGRYLGRNPNLKNKNHDAEDQRLVVAVPHKDREIKTSYHEQRLDFADDYQVYIRVYDDGFAYRFVDQSDDSRQVVDEQMKLSFSAEARTYFPQEESMYSHNERQYIHTDIASLENESFCSLPAMFETSAGKVLITEAALRNYPNMFLQRDKEMTLSATFPKYVLEAVQNTESNPDRNQIIKREADYIAKVDGARSYPWRAFIVSNDDRTFIESNLVSLLSEASVLSATDWIKPGKVAWDWYNFNNLTGVDFRAGLNMDTYTYFIDFASKHGIEYVILDEGWTKSTTEILEDSDELDVPALIDYAESKDVGIILWVLWKPLNENMDEILELYSGWGAKGIKVDFMQRSDQYMVSSYEAIARKCAELNMLVDFHGSFKPAGLERKWPNVVNYEGVMGNEHNKWSANITPEHNVTIPFVRMAAGPIDFTPGSMRNTSRQNFAIRFTRPMSMGTRAHQIAMYVVYEAPLQMLCEAPTIYEKEKESLEFMVRIPTTWDETVVLEGAVSDYVILARRHGDDWYVGAMNDWDARDFEIALVFLDEGTYQMQSVADGINADRNAEDYEMESREVNANDRLRLRLASGGGFAAIIKKVKG